ncbi:MAG: OmpA family protein [Terracidiphilus sp.]|nr:OmpA family protein [Terracidiphilus sp.]
MKNKLAVRILFSSQVAVFVLASAIAVPALAQQTPTEEPQSTPPVAAQQQTPTALKDSKEGFWGRVNPFARKKWVNKRLDPLKDRLSELDEVNAKNARDIQDVDGRAQVGIRRAQSTADGANQTASAAGDQAQRASLTAQGAAGRVDHLNTTVDGLDQYRQISAVEVQFRGGQPIVSAAARKQLDELATTLAGHQGYILEIEGHSRLAGSAGIQSSQRLNEAVKRYLVTEHQIPVYRLHSVALGNAKTADEENVKLAKNSSVQIRLMENSLAAQGAASPHDAASLSGAERP